MQVEEARYTDESTPGTTSTFRSSRQVSRKWNVPALKSQSKKRKRRSGATTSLFRMPKPRSASRVAGGRLPKKPSRDRKTAATPDYDLAEGLESLESELQHSWGNARTRKRPVSQETSRKRLHASGGGPRSRRRDADESTSEPLLVPSYERCVPTQVEADRAQAPQPKPGLQNPTQVEPSCQSDDGSERKRSQPVFGREKSRTLQGTSRVAPRKVPRDPKSAPHADLRPRGSARRASVLQRKSS